MKSGTDTSTSKSQSHAQIPRGHTPGPLIARQVNDHIKPFAVINPNGPHGDDIVAGYLTEADAILFAAAPDMLAALRLCVPILGGVFRPHALLEALDDVHAAIAKAEGRS